MPTSVTAAELGDARAAARRLCLANQADPGRCDDLLLVLSELVGNAVRHGGPPVTYELSHDAADLLVTVEDSNPQPPPAAPGPAPAGAENGRGLLLVAALSRTWGWRPTARGKAVWARI